MRLQVKAMGYKKGKNGKKGKKILVLPFLLSLPFLW